MTKRDEDRLKYLTNKFEKVIKECKKRRLYLTTKGIVYLVMNLMEEK